MRFFFTAVATLSVCMMFMETGPLYAQQMEKLEPAGVSAGDHFAESVAVSGDYIFIGASGDDDQATDAGAVYIYEFDGNDWQGQKLYSDSAFANERFGHSVAVNGDYAIVGAPANGILRGSVHIFKRSGGLWVLSQKVRLLPGQAGDRLGSSVAIDGDRVVVGAGMGDGTGRAYAATRTSLGGVDNWYPLVELTRTSGDVNAGDYFGSSVSISGVYAVVGAHGDASAGSIYVYKYESFQWQRKKKITGTTDDHFGKSVSISADSIAVGIDKESGDPGSVYVYTRNIEDWVLHDELTATDAANLGPSVAMSGSYAIAGAPEDDDQGPGSGSIYLYAWDGSRWVEYKARADDGTTSDSLGCAVAIDGSRAAIGSELAVYVYEEPYDDRCFAYTADIHVKDESGGRWDRLLQGALDMSPPPEFMLCAGDLVSWGAGGTGEANFNQFLSSTKLENNGNSHYVRDTRHRFPIFFCPGNHDYRYWWQFFGPFSLDNYKSKIHSSTYFHERVGQYAIFSLNTGRDKARDINIAWPEGSGLGGSTLDNFEADLDALDELDNDMDTSNLKKIVMMHHPHTNPKGKFNGDGEFLYKKSRFKQLCVGYGVNWLVYGHLHTDDPVIFDLNGNSWSEGEAKCIISPAGKKGHLGREPLGDQPVPAGDPEPGNDKDGYPYIWADITVRITGDVEAWVTDQQARRTGLDGGGHPQEDIPGSLYDRDVVVVTSELVTLRTALTDMSVYKDPAMDYLFEIEALSEGRMTVEVSQRYSDGTYRKDVYKNIPMFYEEGQGSIAELPAPASEVAYSLSIQDPIGTVREKLPLMQWYAHDVDLFQDTFPTDGYSTGTGRIDTAVDLSAFDSPSPIAGDSAAVNVIDPVFGLLEPEPISGHGAAVFIYIARDPSDSPITAAVVADAFRWPYLDSAPIGARTWHRIRMDTCFAGPGRADPVPDRFCVDLNDNYFFNGDTLLFFFGAENSVNSWTWWSQECGTVTDIFQAALAPMEMQVLPAHGGADGDILFVNNGGDRNIPPYYQTAFRMMGIDGQVDRYDKRGPENLVGNGLGSRCVSVANQLMPNYRWIIWDSGDLEQGTVCDGTVGKSPSFQALYEFVTDHTNGGDVGIYFSGCSMAEEWPDLGQPAADFVTAYIPHSLYSGDHSIEHGLSPLVYAEPGGIFTGALGPDSAFAFADSEVVYDFDQIQPDQGANLEMTYDGTGLPMDGAVISAETTANGHRVAVVLSGFSLHHIRNDRHVEMTDRAVFLTHVLRFLGKTLDDPTGVGDARSFSNTLAQNYPNPFNPATAIKYSIAKRSHVTLKVYNVAGQLVTTLVDEVQNPRSEEYVVEWNGKNSSGAPVSSGVYFYRLVAGEYSKSKKMVILK